MFTGIYSYCVALAAGMGSEEWERGNGVVLVHDRCMYLVRFCSEIVPFYIIKC